MTVTGIITALVVGLIVGALGRLAVPGRQNLPVWLTILIGVVAALTGTVVARLAGIEPSGFSLLTLLIQVGLAALAVFAVTRSTGRRRAGTR
ncbi:GlsB/YeaQ/YmgE family stress response membrane protein [Spirilliplanes yamanashiensis]|uniref:Transglycosylase n=1 Tax=Spirilliplanes yamanashiensis TaxID=42233 RepID=A0A8J3YAC4_9ACTN|nr:GlsB/YeaQ/YmgE family stress response membrane protein [Spirilliplanes yamanashiensis]MDP9818155.1 putative membrane protein YeaQ/YmgE (transglycosylase-associated protein family) [Spirilliplanes yamanashiensis]GIJ04966.1 transglycosylase [Spirilliplanes yamanashiensis]